MPNHIYMLLQPHQPHTLRSIMHSLKSYTATQANKFLARKGEFWMPEYYDHLIRDPADHRRSADYILRNPSQANLTNWPWLYPPPDGTYRGLPSPPFRGHPCLHSNRRFDLSCTAQDLNLANRKLCMGTEFELKNAAYNCNATCPNCGHSNAAVIYQRIVVPDNPKSRNRLRFGNFNDCVCANCSERRRISTFVHVIDPVRKYAIFLSDDDVHEPDPKLHPIWHPATDFVQHRLTDTYAEFFEKIAIFDSSLDDRLIKALKFIRGHEFTKHGRTADIEGLTQRFLGIDETPGREPSLLFQWFDAAGNRKRLDRDPAARYLKMTQKFVNRFPPYSHSANRWLRVDLDYVLDLITLHDLN